MYKVVLLFVLMLVVLVILRRMAFLIQLVDKPNHRKKHTGSIPLVGGISLYVSLWLIHLFSPDVFDHFNLFMVCTSILIFVGALDDKFDLPVLPRIIMQIALAILIACYGLYFVSLGSIWTPNDIYLGLFGIFFTVIVVSGAINAFNMVDGIDGLLGALSLTTLGSLSIVFIINNDFNMFLWSFSFLVSFIPYLIFNLIPFARGKYKVFMGDAGSTLIGFIVIWLIIIASQGEHHAISAIKALWLVVVPLIDMIGVMFRRIYLGRSPFKADRKHLHHIFMRAGFSSYQTLFIIWSLSVILALIGIVAQVANVPDILMLVLFFVVLIIYIMSMKRVWRLLCLYRKKKFKSQLC